MPCFVITYCSNEFALNLVMISFDFDEINSNILKKFKGNYLGNFFDIFNCQESA